MISIKKILKKLFNLEYYTSQADLFLEKYHQSHPGQSHSQHLEKEKYARIFKLRDHAEPVVEPDKLWDKF